MRYVKRVALGIRGEGQKSRRMRRDGGHNEAVGGWRWWMNRDVTVVGQEKD